MADDSDPGLERLAALVEAVRERLNKEERAALGWAQPPHDATESPTEPSSIELPEPLPLLERLLGLEGTSIGPLQFGRVGTPYSSDTLANWEYELDLREQQRDQPPPALPVAHGDPYSVYVDPSTGRVWASRPSAKGEWRCAVADDLTSFINAILWLFGLGLPTNDRWEEIAGPVAPPGGYGAEGEAEEFWAVLELSEEARTRSCERMELGESDCG